MADKTTKAAAGAEAGADQEMTAAQVAAAIGATVRVPKRDKKTGARVVGNKGVYEVEERRATAADILSWRRRDGRLVAVTVDGRRHEVTA